MSRLKNKNHAVPNGFAYVWAATGYDLQRTMPHRSFSDCCTALLAHIKANPHQAAQSQMPTDIKGVENLVENYTVKVLLKGGYTDFIMEDVVVNPQLRPSKTFQPLPPRPVSAVVAAKSTMVGIKTVALWLGSDIKPVDKAIAEERARICTVCPLNGDPNFIERLSAIGAREVKDMLAVKHDLDLTTPYDEKLKTCMACSCHLPLKVWVDKDFALSQMSEETKAKLDKNCWLR